MEFWKYTSFWPKNRLAILVKIGSEVRGYLQLGLNLISQKVVGLKFWFTFPRKLHILRYLIDKEVKSSEINDFEVLVGISVFGSHELPVCICMSMALERKLLTTVADFPPHSRSVASWDRGFDGSGLAALTLPLSISSQRSSCDPNTGLEHFSILVTYHI